MRFLTLLIFTTVSIFANSLHWVNSFNTALALAKKQNKPIMVYIEAKHCPWCEKMKEETLEDSDTIRVLNKEYILVKLDIDSSDVKKYFPNTYMTPTTYFVNYKMQLLAQITGYTNNEFFFWYLGDVDRKLKELKGKK